MSRSRSARPVPAIFSTTPNFTSITLGTGQVTLNDSADLEEGMSPTGTINWTLYLNNGTTPVYTVSVPVNGNGVYTTPGYTLSTTGNVTGTYQWDATYTGDKNNASYSDVNNPNERTVVSPAKPAIATTPSTKTASMCSTTTTVLKDSAVISGGYYETGNIVFTLYSPTNTLLDTETVAVNGNGTYTTPTGYTLPSSGATGTYQWDASFTPASSNPNNLSASDINNPNEQVTVGFAPGSISGTKYNDPTGAGLNLNGTAKAGETPLAGVTINLYSGTSASSGSFITSVKTDQNGNYTFGSLAPGKYFVQESVPSGSTETGGVSGYAVNLVAGQAVTGNNFSDFQNICISGTKFQDVCGDGFSPEDPGLAGVTIDLFKNGGTTPIATTITTSNGTYSFNNLGPGSYFVQEVVPANWVQTGGNAGYTIVATSGVNSTGNNFDDYQEVCNISEVTCISYVINGCTKVTSLAGNTHEGDQVQVTFTLAPGDNDTLSLVSYTAPDGTFNASDAYEQVVFDSATGTYCGGTHTLCITIPLCYYQIDFVCGPVICHFGPAGSNSFYHAQNRIFDSDNSGTDACYNGGAELSGFVYNDVNKDKTDDGTDKGLAGVIVTLTGKDSSGRSIHLVRTTGADGSFDFMGLKAGTYTLVETQPSGYTSDATDVGVVNGSTDGKAVSYAGGEITNIVLSFTSDGTSYDFGEIKN